MRCGEHLVHWWVKGHRPETTFSWDLTGEGSGSLELNPLETKESEHEIRKKEICIEFWLNLYTLNDMIEKLCPGLALCSVYNHLFLLCSSKIIFPVRAALFCFSTNMEAMSLVSTSWVLCTADSVFYCMLNYDSHILVGTKLLLSLDTRDHVLACMWSSVWDVNSLLLHFQHLWLPLMFILTVNSSCKGCFQGWMSRSTQALGSLPGLSLLELISVSAPAKADVLKVLPCERSTFSYS